MTDLKRLENDFTNTMRETCIESQRHGYRPTYFMRLLSEWGGVGAAKRLLQASKAQSGLTSLWERDLLHLSAEAHVVKEKWAPLFTESERAEARKRLEDYEYRPPD